MNSELDRKSERFAFRIAAVCTVLLLTPVALPVAQTTDSAQPSKSMLGQISGAFAAPILANPFPRQKSHSTLPIPTPRRLQAVSALCAAARTVHLCFLIFPLAALGFQLGATDSQKSHRTTRIKVNLLPFGRDKEWTV